MNDMRGEGGGGGGGTCGGRGGGDGHGGEVLEWHGDRGLVPAHRHTQRDISNVV